MQLRLISKDQIQAALTLPRTIELMRDAYTALSAGQVDSPLRTALVNDQGTVLYKPAYSDAAGIFCAKVVSVFSGNQEKGLPVTPGIIIVNNAETGMPEALLEAGYLTSLRTGAATGITIDTLAPPEVKTAALFGTGGQARHQLEALLCVRPFEKIYVFSGNPKNAERFCHENADLAPNCQLIPTPERSILPDCEVIVTATTSPTPVLTDDELHPAVVISAIGSLGPKRTEIAAETLLRSHVFVDQRAACLAEAGELTLMREAGLIDDTYHPTEIGEVIAGTAPHPGHDKPIVFKSVGNAVQDLVCSAEILKVAAEQNLGTQASL